MGGGALTVRGKGQAPGKSSPLTMMARDASYEVQVVVTPQNDGAGALGLFYNPNNGVFAELKGGRLRVYGAKETLADREWKAVAAHLKIINRRHSVEFLASENGRDWQSLVAGYDASGFKTNILHGFQALRPSLTANGGGEARFTEFSYRAL